MGPPHPSSRNRPAPLARELRDRLLRAVAELRALEAERKGRRAADRPTDDVSRRVEAKAREVFRLSGEADEAAGRRH